ncbi:MAG: LytR C-terminal domain-containing protein, partial [Solirubrobacteraceae bacterium]
APAGPATPGAAPSRAAQLRTDRPRATPGGRAGGRDPVPPRRAAAGGRPRRAAYIAVAAVLVITLVVVIVAATSGGDSKTKAPNKITPTQPAGASKKGAASPVPRGDVKVAVLNGTTQAGLGAQVGDQIAAGGFQRGDVTNANDQQAPKTVVYYASGQRRAGQEVADVVKASSVQPIDPDTQALAGSDAKVVVLVGADKT